MRTSRFTPSTMPAEHLERLFVVREPLLDRLMDRVQELGSTRSPHHTLLVGPRGAGKTHLISLVYHRTRALGTGIRIAWLPEDPWTIVSYRHLVLAMLRELVEHEDLGALSEEEAVARLRGIMAEGPVLVLMENVDQVLESIGELGQQRFRHFLQTQSALLVIGSTTRLDHNLVSQDLPLFGYFDTMRLDPFTPEQAIAMLTALAGAQDNESLLKELKTPAALAKIRTIAHLAGGQPRLWALLGDALTVEQLNHLVDLLLGRFDDLTPYYQERLARLSPQHRLIVSELASADRPLPVKEIARRTQIDQRTVARAVIDLDDRGWLRPADTVFADLLDGRRTYYELAEPLARLAFQIKESRGEPLRLVVDFLTGWYDLPELGAAGQEGSAAPYCEMAMSILSGDETIGLTKHLTSLPVTRKPSLAFLGQVEDALAAAQQGDAGPVMDLSSTVRQALEHRAGPQRRLAPIRLDLLELACREMGEVPHEPESGQWVKRAERLDAEEAVLESRLMLVRWLASAWRMEEAEAVLATVGVTVPGEMDDPAVLDARMDLAYAYLAVGRLGEAVTLFEQVLADRVRVLGPDHPSTLVSRNNLAGAYVPVGDLKRAVPLYEQTLADRERVLGADHPDTLVSRNNLAGAYESVGDLGRAIPLYEQTLADCERVLGADHPDTLVSRNNLAGAYRSVGDLGRAVPLYEQTLADRQRVLGADHPSTLVSRNNLAYAYRSVGDLGRAIPLYEQTLADHERVLGADHPSTLVSRNNLAYAYRSVGDLGRAIPLYEQTLADH
ncbi:tetratricopeptide repeat protein, partial [Actinomyces bowdenii]